MSGLEDALEYYELDKQFSSQLPKGQPRVLCMSAIFKPSIITASLFAEKLKQDVKPKVLDARKAYNICEELTIFVRNLQYLRGICYLHLYLYMKKILTVHSLVSDPFLDSNSSGFFEDATGANTSGSAVM